MDVPAGVGRPELDTAWSSLTHPIISQLPQGNMGAGLHAQHRASTAACWRHTLASTDFWQLSGTLTIQDELKYSNACTYCRVLLANSSL